MKHFYLFVLVLILPSFAFSFGRSYWSVVDGIETEYLPWEEGRMTEFEHGLSAKKEAGKFGFIDTKGEWQVAPKFDAVTSFRSGYACVAIVNKWGILDTNGSYLLQPQYQKILKGSEKNYFLVQKDDSLYALFGGTQWKFITNFANLKKYENPVLPDFLVDEEFIQIKAQRFIDEKTGEEFTLKEHYHSMGFSEDRLLIKNTSTNRYRFLDRKGDVTFSTEYRRANEFKEGYALVSPDSLYGYIDKWGKSITPFKYKGGYDFSEGIAAVKYGKLWGYINTSGEKVTNFFATDIRSFSEGLGAAKSESDNKWTYINKAGNRIGDFKYDEAGNFQNGYAQVRLNGKTLIIDKNENVYFSHPYPSKRIKRLENNFIIVTDSTTQKEKLYHMEMPEGRLIGEYDRIDYFAENRAKVSLGYLDNFIDENGNLISDTWFSGANHFLDGFARVESKGRYGYINKKGELVIPFQYEEAKDFSRGTAPVKENGVWKLIYRDDCVLQGLSWNNPNRNISGDSPNNPYMSRDAKLPILINYEAPAVLGMEHFHVYQDGKNITSGKGDDFLPQGKTFEAKVELHEGLQTIEVRGCNQRTPPLYVQYKPIAPKKKPNLHILAIGYNYKDKSNIKPLNYAEADARAFVKTFSALKGKLYENVYIDTLLGTNVKRKEVLRKLKELNSRYTNIDHLKHINPEDVVMVFFSGHGEVICGNPHFFTQEYDNNDPEIDAISFKNDVYPQIEPIKAKSMLFLDFCKSGNVSVSNCMIASRDTDPNAFQEAIKSIQKATSGLITYASCVSQQKSYESSLYGHGLFTQAILEATRDGKAFQGIDYLDFTALDDYVSKRVPEMVEGINKQLALQNQPLLPLQTPQPITNTFDMKMAIYAK